MWPTAVGIRINLPRVSVFLFASQIPMKGLSSRGGGGDLFKFLNLSGFVVVFELWAVSDHVSALPG